MISFFMRFFFKLKSNKYTSNSFWIDVKDEKYDKIFKSYKTKSKLSKKTSGNTNLQGDLNPDNYYHIHYHLIILYQQQ